MSDEKNIATGSNEKKGDKKSDKSTNSAETGKLMKLVQAKFVEYRAEFRKIIWLSRKELTKRTVTVIITSLLFGLAIFGMDTIFALGTKSFFTFIGQ